jgi:hypothetical protein
MMPWWVKALGALSALLFIAGFAGVVLAMGPPENVSLERAAGELGAAGLLLGLLFLRAFFSWERIKFRARAWTTGRREARARQRRRR